MNEETKWNNSFEVIVVINVQSLWKIFSARFIVYILRRQRDRMRNLDLCSKLFGRLYSVFDLWQAIRYFLNWLRFDEKRETFRILVCIAAVATKRVMCTRWCMLSSSSSSLLLYFFYHFCLIKCKEENEYDRSSRNAPYLFCIFLRQYIMWCVLHVLHSYSQYSGFELLPLFIRLWHLRAARCSKTNIQLFWLKFCYLQA